MCSLSFDFLFDPRLIYMLLVFGYYETKLLCIFVCKILCGRTLFFFFFGYLGVGLFSEWGVSELSNWLPKGLSILYSHQQCESSSVSTSLTTLDRISLLNFSHPSACLVVPQCGFNFHIPADSWCWASFSVFLGMPNDEHLSCAYGPFGYLL